MRADFNLAASVSGSEYKCMCRTPGHTKELPSVALVENKSLHLSFLPWKCRNTGTSAQRGYRLQAHLSHTHLVPRVCEWALLIITTH